MIHSATQRKNNRPACSEDSPDGDPLKTLQEAFALFGQQSRQLEDAYQSLKLDLAASNEQLQLKNRELTSKIQELRQVSSRLESVVESMAGGLLVVNMEGRIERCNSAAEHLLSRSRDKIELAPLHDVVSMDKAASLLSEVLAGGAPVFNRPWKIQREEGALCSLVLDMAPVSSPDHQVLGAIVHLRDVTDLHRLEKQLRSSERLAALGEMAASVAHEIRNPLGTIEGFARLLRRDLASMPAPLKLAERIVEGAQNLNYVISNLLTYARPMQLQMEPVDAGEVFALCRETLLDRAARAGVSCAIEDPPPDVKAWGDVRQIAQVVMNLGINAIEACSSGGSVQLKASGSRQTVFFVVRDSGCGLDAVALKKIFDPFFTSKEGGTGLGLSLTRKIVDAHGGEITVESQPGCGSLFTVALPKEGADR